VQAELLRQVEGVAVFGERSPSEPIASRADRSLGHSAGLVDAVSNKSR